MAPPFSKLLVANRGEIAVRIVRACRELGIASVAIYSEADRDALHVRLADEALPCGGSPPAESYLDVARVVACAVESGAEAVHPGYGFLSENGDFADACKAAGLRFVGPPGDVMRRMGDKVLARQAMQAAGVPIVPGTTSRLRDDEALSAAREIGFPLMVKASAGGGGRGLRLVPDAEALPRALEQARAEAQSSFGDGSLYLERRILNPRHVEVQVLADAAGACVHLFERECSVQRRHQKLLEEAPAPGLPPDLRARMGAAAVSAARAVGYEGAGTVEFLLDADGRFSFLEMNTRIQVEHGVTEAITGVDLVKAQIRIAAGAALPFRQEQLEMRGHAVEARIYAEDPARGFLPSPGRLLHWRAPEGPGLRIDAGVTGGSEVPVFYDALLAKLIAWGEDRAEALARLDGALCELRVGGVKTSLPFHRWLLREPAFRAAHEAPGGVHTGFVESRLAEGPVVLAEPGVEQLARAAAARAVLGGPGVGTLKQGKLRTPVELAASDAQDRWTVRIGDAEALLVIRELGGDLWLVGGETASAEVLVTPARKGVDVLARGQHFAIQIEAEGPSHTEEAP